MKPANLDLVVVTGAGSGIGRAVAVAFAAKGATVVVTDIAEGSAKETAALIAAAGGRAVAHQLDVADADQFEAVARMVHTEHGVADVVVNNAAIATLGAALDVEPADWDRLIDVNLMGVVHGTRLFGQQMAQRGNGGHIVNIASMAAFSPSSALAPYCTTKAAVRMLSDCLRVEMREHGIGVTAICPGFIATAIYTDAKHIAVDADTGTRRAAMAGSVTALMASVGLFSSPEYVAKVVLRSVRHNWATVPVRPEAWAAYLMSRLSPGLLRVITTTLTSPHAFDVAERAAYSPLGKKVLGLSRGEQR